MFTKYQIIIFFGVLMTFFSGFTQTFSLSEGSSKPHVSGPNCWNGAMVSLGVLKHHRFMHQDEFAYLVEKLCSPIEKPQLGSLGRLYDDVGDVHAYVWVDNETIYAKHSNSADESYKIMPFDEMMNSYYLKKDCLLLKVKPSDCFRETKYYSCTQPLGSLQLEIDKFETIEKKLNILVFSQQTRWRHKENCVSDSYLNRNKILTEIQEDLIDVKEQKIYDPSFVLTWLESARIQLYEVEKSSWNYRCQGMSKEEKYKEYKKVRNLLNELSRIVKKVSPTSLTK